MKSKLVQIHRWLKLPIHMVTAMIFVMVNLWLLGEMAPFFAESSPNWVGSTVLCVWTLLIIYWALRIVIKGWEK